MIIGGVILFIPHAFSISFLRSLYLESLSTVFKEVFFSVGIDKSMSRQVLSLFFTTVCSLFAFIYLPVWISISQSIRVVAWFSVIVAGSCS